MCFPKMFSIAVVKKYTLKKTLSTFYVNFLQSFTVRCSLLYLMIIENIVKFFSKETKLLLFRKKIAGGILGF